MAVFVVQGDSGQNRAGELSQVDDAWAYVHTLAVKSKSEQTASAGR